jgi:RHS repeat-associated protein
MRARSILLGLLVMALLTSGGVAHAQEFTPEYSKTFGNQVSQPGAVISPDGSGTVYAMHLNRMAPVAPGSLSNVDAYAWLEFIDAAGIQTTLPPGWGWHCGSHAYQYDKVPDPFGEFQMMSLQGVITFRVTWGTNGSQAFLNPQYCGAAHTTNGANPPVSPDPQPNEANTPCPDSECADPVSMMTGLYYQEDTDLDVPDVMPIRLTRTYRTKDTGKRVFGIGASHPYEQVMLRDSLCTAARVYLPDGAYIHFTRTSGTNCLDSTLQHTTTQTAFYAATLAWDPAFQRYRLKFKDGTEWRFSEYGSLVAMRDRNGNQLTLARALAQGLAGNLTKITTPNGRFLTLTYDTSNRITQVADILGRTITYTYDASGRLWKVTNPMTGVSEYTYDTSHRLLTNKEPNGNLHVTNTYDANGRVQTQTRPDSTTYQFAYTLDGTGKVTQTDMTDPRGVIKRLTFNSAGYTLTSTEALGQPETQSTTYEWQAGTNLLLSVTDALNRKTAYTYDSKGNVLTVTRLATTPNAVTTTFTYDPIFNQILTVTDPLNHTTTFGYDTKGNLLTITNALNKVTTLTVNTQGQPLTIKDPLNNITTFTYELGDLIKVKDPLNRETQRMLDAAGRLRSIINPLGQKTVYTPDALDRITQLTDAINGVTQFGYDANSNLLTVTDAKSQQTVYTYSNMNRTATRKDPLLNTETYTYDNNGNLATVLDRKSQTTTYTYDPLNRRTKTTFQDGTSTNYTYDAGNRITQVQEKNAGGTVTDTITRVYDGLDRLTQEVTAQGTVNYTYDNASRRATMTVVGQTQVVYTYDNANRLTNIQQGTSTVTIAYDDADRRTSVTYPNTNKVEYLYNVASELTTVTYKKGTTTLGTLTYTYDAAGNRIKTGGTFARSNLPPALATATYNANNQQLTFGTTTETYDLNGNLATSTDAGVTTTYTWNVRNQLIGISRTGFTASFTYDSFGRRSGKTINGTLANFVYDGLNPVQEKNGAAVTANLLTGLGIDEFFTRTDGVGVRSLLPDALGSTVALGDGTGTLQTQYTYEPFGMTTQTGAASTSSYKFTGREDDGSGLLYYRTRYYQPRFQRFIGEDPIEYEGGDVNLYAYVGNSPLVLDDPFGLAACPCPMPINQQDLQSLAAIIYNETSSLSGPGILDARIFIAHVTVNRRNAGTLGGVAPSQLSRSARAAIRNGVPSANMALAQSLLAAALALGGCDPDLTNGARFFNFRPNASLNLFFGQPVQTQVGPLNNSAPSPGLPASGIFSNTYGR